MSNIVDSMVQNVMYTPLSYYAKMMNCWVIAKIWSTICPNICTGLTRSDHGLTVIGEHAEERKALND